MWRFLTFRLLAVPIFMKRLLLKLCYHTRVERLGTAALVLLCGLIFSAPVLLRLFQKAPPPMEIELSAKLKAAQPSPDLSSHAPAAPFYFDPNTASAADFQRLGLSPKVAAGLCRYREKGGHFRSPADFAKLRSVAKPDMERLLPFVRIGGSAQGALASAERPKVPLSNNAAPPTLFPFDPNTASEAELLRLGIPPKTVQTLLKYRDKGGRFKEAAALQKLYTLPQGVYERIAPYVKIAPADGAFAQRPQTYQNGNTPMKRPDTRPKPTVLDINRATLEAWMELPGIGEFRARQIINFREKLGGFLSIGQVGEIRMLPDSTFQQIKPFLALDYTDPRKINLNTASIADLDAHPYCSKKQAEHIVRYREQHGAYASVEDLTHIETLRDRAWLAKIKPYLEAY